MATENWRWLAAIIAAHPNHEVVGRTRLQKTVWLLQRLGFPTDYTYSLHFYGPYSEEVKGDIRVAEQLGLVTETPRCAMDGTEYFVLTTKVADVLPNIQEFKSALDQLASEDAVVLELAATYDAFLTMRLTPAAALENLREMKGNKCGGDRERRALDLLGNLNLREKAA